MMQFLMSRLQTFLLRLQEFAWIADLQVEWICIPWLTGQRVIRCEHSRLVKDRFFDRFRLVLGCKPASGI